MTTPHCARSASALWPRAPFPAQVLPDEVLTPRPVDAYALSVMASLTVVTWQNFNS